MITAALEQLKGFFAPEFLFGVFTPVLLFLSASGIMLLAITDTTGATFDAWLKAPLDLQVLLLLMAVVLAVLCAYLVYTFEYAIVQQFEGYGSSFPPLRWLLERRRRFHMECWKYLRDTGQRPNLPADVRVQLEQLARFYPEVRPGRNPTAVLATLVGNTLRASELYATDRYGITAGVIWERLAPLLPDTATAGLIDKQLRRDVMLLLTALSAAYSLIWFPVTLLFTDRPALVLLSALGVPLAWLAYGGAVQSAWAYGEQVKVIFDLHRHLLLEALGRKPPAAIEEERALWVRLSYFFNRGLALPPPDTAPGDPQGWDRVAAALAAYLAAVTPAPAVPPAPVVLPAQPPPPAAPGGGGP